MGHFTDIFRLRVEMSGLRHAHGGAGMANLLQPAARAGPRQTDPPRGRPGPLPCLGKAQLRHGKQRLRHHAAGSHAALPVDPEGAAPGPAGHTLAGCTVADIILRRQGEALLHGLGPLPELLRGQPQPIPLDAVFRRLAGGEPVVAAYQRLVPPDRREHVGSQLHGGTQLLGDAVNFRHIRHVVRRHGHVQLYPHAQLPQGPDILRDPGKHGTAAQPLVGGIAGPVEGDVEAERRLVPEKVQPVPAGKKLSDCKVVFVGDGTQVCASLGFITTHLGMKFVHYGPKGHQLTDGHQAIMERNCRESGGSFLVTDDRSAVRDADFIYTDVWYGLYENEMPKEQRVEVFHDYQVNRELMSLGAIGCKFLHCLPATRGEDVTDEVADSAASLCWEQAGNRLTAMRGLLVYFTQCRQRHTELEMAAAREQLERFMADRGLS